MKYISTCLYSLSLALLACQPAVSDLPPPHIIWINAEDISPAWGCYGDPYAKTPRLDALAEQSVRYDRAYAPAPICSPARTALITGMYGTAMGTQHLRNEISRTPGLGTVPEYLREAGYFTTLYGKTDYNFDPEGIWDYWEGDLTPWRQRPAGQPFFSMFTFGVTHEGRGNRYDRYQEAVAQLPDSLLHDPALAPVPPYYPDSDSARWLWARYHDLISVFDQQVGAVLDSLQADGLMDRTILFVFADHGFGMPRYKRWLNETGLRVPLLVHVPEAYQHLLRPGDRPGQGTAELVSFVDFAPSTLRLAGASLPDHLQGQPFLGGAPAVPRRHIYGARSRADDMYEISRAVRDERYLYVRHYLPHLPYIQEGKIFRDGKEAFGLLRQARATGTLPPAGEAMFQPKPIEELYDLQADPDELHNLAEDPAQAEIKAGLRRQLAQWIWDHRDAGFLIEPEMMRRAGEDSPYTMAQDPQRYDLSRIYRAAEWVGTAPLDTLVAGLKDPDSGVRWWAATALRVMGPAAAPAQEALRQALQDEAPAVQIAAAEALCALGACDAAALAPLARHLQAAEAPSLVLYAARTLQLLGEAACPLAPVMTAVRTNYLSPPGGTRTYRDFNFASFIGWALEPALDRCEAR